jgi:hypothetical protein
MLLTGLIVGILSTVALVWTSVLASPPGPPPGSPQNPAPQPPPPHSAVLVIVSAAFFVVGWVTVAVAVARDHLVQRIGSAAAEAASDRDSARADLLRRLTKLIEFGEQRETDAYINGFRAAEEEEDTDGPDNVHPIRTVLPPRDD